MYCSNCGKKLTDGQRFCSECGSPCAADDKVKPEERIQFNAADQHASSEVKNHPLPLILGIAGLVMTGIGAVLGIYAFWLVFPGLGTSAAAWILSYALAGKKCRPGRRMLVGRRLGMIGVILSIVLISVLLALLFILPYDRLK